MPTEVIEKIEPKNNAFVGLIDAKQIIGGVDNKIPIEAIPDGIGGGGGLTIDGAHVNDIVIFNGTTFVAAPLGTRFDLTVGSFSSTAGYSGNTIEIGTGVWKDVGAVSFSASYTNGPPTSAAVSYTGWSNTLDLGSPTYAGPTSNTEAVNYPNPGDTITFSLRVSKDTINLQNSIYYIFQNRMYLGYTTNASAPASSDVKRVSYLRAVSGGSFLSSELIFLPAGSGSGTYIIFSYPTRYGDAYFSIDGLTGGFQSSYELMDITNASGYSESYRIYRSIMQFINLNKSITASQWAMAQTNYVYWGRIGDPSNGLSYSANDVLNADESNKEVSSFRQKTFTLTAGDSQYIFYAYPSRLGIALFYSGGFEGGFSSPTLLTIPNGIGISEQYYLFISSNSNLGTTTITVS